MQGTLDNTESKESIVTQISERLVVAEERIKGNENLSWGC